MGHNLTSQIIDAIKNASCHVAIFSLRYGESEWCLKELVYMLDSGAPIIPVFYHVDPADLRWTHREGGAYTQGLRKLESQNDSTTIQKWREVLCRFADVSGLHLQETCNGDEGLLVEEIVQRVLKKIKRILLVQEFHRSRLYGGITGGAVWNDGTHSGIRRITMIVNDNNFLTSVKLCYGLQGDGSIKDKYIEGHRPGVINGFPSEYDLNYPEEMVTKISGYFGTYGAWKVIKSLTFHTNQRKLGPCGEEGGPSFETEMGGKIVGLFGRGGDLVDAIGVYTLKTGSRNENFHCSQRHGGRGGAYWNDGTYSGIRRIITTTNGNNWLTSIQLHYALEGDASVKDKYIEALPHGLGFEQDNRIVYDLNYPEEFLTKISGRLGKCGSNEVIISLTFHTNQRDHGPCGLEAGTYFETEAGKIVGLFGSSGHLLDSIGLYMLEPRSSADDLSESG